MVKSCEFTGVKLTVLKLQKNAVSSAVDDDEEEDKCYDSESFSGLYNNINSDNPEGVASNMHQVW